MRNPFKRRRKAAYVAERQRLLESMKKHEPDSDEYKAMMARLDQLDKITNRSNELTKTVIPALGTLGAVTGIYALQQFAGVIVPKALEAHAARQQQKKDQESD